MNRLGLAALGHHSVLEGLATFSVSLAGFAIVFSLMEATHYFGRGRRIFPTILIPALCALGVWSLCFSAIQGGLVGEGSTYDLALISLSIAVVFTGFILAYGLVIAVPHDRYSRPHRMAGSMLAIASVVVMHYAILKSLRLPAHELQWSALSVSVAVSVPLLAGLVGGYYWPAKPLWRILFYTFLATLAVCWLHFVSTGLSVVVPSASLSDHGLSAFIVNKVVTGFITCLILTLTFVAGGLWRSNFDLMQSVQDAIEVMPVGLSIYDQDDRLLIWNQKYAQLNPEMIMPLKKGMTYHQVLTLGLKSKLVPSNMTDREWIEERSRNHCEGDWLLSFCHSDEWVHIQTRRTGNGGLITITNDFTEQKRHEQELANALSAAQSASVAKSQFLANMSHEIRTPLNGIMAVADALHRTPLQPKQAEMVDLICASSRTLKTLLSDILDLARVESGQMTLAPEPIELACLVHESTQLYANSAREKGLAFNVHIAPDARIWVKADPVRTKQVIGNLVSNAVKFTDEGSVTLNVDRIDGQIRFTVADTGIGFDPESRDRLFKRFEQIDNNITRRFGGSGLGLSIVAQLVEMMNGSIDGTSVPETGSIFTVTLPLPEVTPVQTKAAETGLVDDLGRAAQSLTQASSSQATRILLADDNPTNRRVVQLILDAQNIQVSEAADGQQALDIFTAQDFDLVLMDMQMPVMDGLAATRAIRALESQRGTLPTPIIMLTANAMPEHVQSSLDAGADAHLSKPFNVSQFLELTYNLTARNQQPA